MAKKHTIKLYARLLQKGTYQEYEIPEDIRAEVVELAKTLPLREDMKAALEQAKNDEETEVKEEVAEEAATEESVIE